MSDEIEKLEALKPRRKQDPKGRPSKTKQKGAPVVGGQARTLFGQPGAPKPGLTTEQALLRTRNGEMAERIKFGFLSSVLEVQDKLLKADKTGEVVQMLNRDILTLVHDALDRYQGKALQSVDLSSKDGSMSPNADVADAVLDAIKRKHAAEQ